MIIKYSTGGRSLFTNFEVVRYNKDEAAVRLVEVSSGVKITLYISSLYGNIVDMNDNNTVFSAVN